MKHTATGGPSRAAARGTRTAFRASEFHRLLDDAGIALVLLDGRLRLRLFTPAMQDIFSLQESDRGRPLAEIARKFPDAELVGEAGAALASAGPIEREVTGDNGRVYLRRVAPHRAASGRVRAVIITFLDISSRKRAEATLLESEQRHRLIFDGIREYAIFMLDPSGSVATWNSGSERMLGYTSAEAIGRPLSLLFTDEDRDADTLAGKLQRARDHGSIREEGWHVRRNGSRFWASGMLAALNDSAGRPHGFVSVLRDNTDRKIGEEILRQSKNAAEAANAAKDHFLANVSHELRTPLSATLLWAKLLNTPETVDSATLREGLEAIEKSAKEQQVLIEELMDISRIAAGKLQIQLRKVALVPMLQAALATFRSLAAEKDVAFEEHLDADLETVRADPHRLKQVVTNLLANALKFTPPGGLVTVRCERRGDNVEIRVTDTGRGIARDFVPHLFDRFTQAEPAQSSVTGGLGLGLAISRQLVELHGGTIQASSPGPGQGSTFIVRLPLPRLKQSQSNPPRPAPRLPRLAGLNVLLVEDVEETRKVLAAVLRQAGAVVTTAESAAHAFEQFCARRPDVILSDLGLGRISGHGLMLQIRQWESEQKTAPVPAVALTAYADEHNRRRALESGFQRSLTKPIEPYTLLSTLFTLHSAR